MIWPPLIQTQKKSPRHVARRFFVVMIDLNLDDAEDLNFDGLIDFRMRDDD